MSLPSSSSSPSASTSATPALTTSPLFWRNRQVLFPLTESRLRLQFVEGLRDLMIDINRFETALLLDSRKPVHLERHALADGIPIGIAGAIGMFPSSPSSPLLIS
jgi:hypothetical protein